MNRFHQFLLIGSTTLSSWLGMQAVHELGHCAGAWLSRGRVERVVLHPLTISRTDLTENPHPLIVVWAGPVIGVVVPLILWAIAVATRLSFAFLFRFFAGFCLLANGQATGDFGRYGPLVSIEPPKVKLRIERPEVARALAQILAEHTVEDVIVEDPPLEEVIAAMFSRVSESPPP